MHRFLLGLVTTGYRHVPSVRHSETSKRRACLTVPSRAGWRAALAAILTAVLSARRHNPVRAGEPVASR